MVSPWRTPSTTSKFSSPAIPTFTGRNVATPLCTMNTPSDSFFFVRFDVSAGVAAWAEGGEVDADRRSVDTGVFSRTVSAMIGIASACLRVSVTIRAVAERSGLTSLGGLASVISTS